MCKSLTAFLLFSQRPIAVLGVNVSTKMARHCLAAGLGNALAVCPPWMCVALHPPAVAVLPLAELAARGDSKIESDRNCSLSFRLKKRWICNGRVIVQ